MAFQRLQFRPGVVRDQTNYTGEGGWWDGDKVRFYSGYPQKLGGWKEYTANTLIGTCRQMWGWITTFSDNFLGLGTNAKVYIEAGGNLFGNRWFSHNHSYRRYCFSRCWELCDH